MHPELYKKLKSKFVAYDGGEVPDEEETEPQEDPQPTVEPVAPEAEPVEQDTAPAPQAAPQSMKDVLMRKYASANDDSGIKEARVKRDNVNAIADIGHGLSQMFSARGVANGLRPDDGKFYEGLKQEGQQGVADAEGERQNKVQAFLRTNDLQRQMATDALAKGDSDRKQKAFKWQEDTHDGKSEYSKQMQGQFSKLWGVDATGIPAVQLESMAKQYEVKARINEQKAASELRAEIQKQNNLIHAQQIQDGKDRKVSQDQGKAYTEMTSKTHGGRGDPADVKQARMDQYAGAKADELLSEPDLNNVSPQKVALVAAEMEKMATGGQGTESGRQGLNAKTFQSQWAEFKNKFVGPEGQVSGANLAPFLKQHKEYIDGMSRLAHEKVNKYQRDVFDDYAGSGRISGDHQDAYRKKYPDQFPEDREPTKPGQPVAPKPEEPGQAPVTKKPSWAK